jgi:hypothetical protein
MLAVIRGLRSEMWSALPGIVVSFNAEAQSCEVQPAIKAVIRDPLGAENWVDLPVLPDVPVVFPRAGGFALTFPIKPGDECLVVFSSRCIDAWWQSGGTQQQIEQRLHDLSDGFCIPGPTSQPRKLSNVSTSSVQLRDEDGGTSISIQPGGMVRINAPTSITLQSPAINLEGNVEIIGGFDQHSGHATMEGPLDVDNEVFANGIKVSSHVHGGVQDGPNRSGGPQNFPLEGP